MTDEYDDLEAAAKKATPGPWTITGRYPSEDGPGYDCDVSGPGLAANVIQCPGSPQDEDNAAFIVAANPAAVLRLIADLREARAIVGALAESESFREDTYHGDWDCLVCPHNGTDLKTLEINGIKEQHWAECALRRAVEYRERHGK